MSNDGIMPLFSLNTCKKTYTGMRFSTLRYAPCLRVEVDRFVTKPSPNLANSADPGLVTFYSHQNFNTLNIMQVNSEAMMTDTFKSFIALHCLTFAV